MFILDFFGLGGWTASWRNRSWKKALLSSEVGSAIWKTWTGITMNCKIKSLIIIISLTCKYVQITWITMACLARYSQGRDKGSCDEKETSQTRWGSTTQGELFSHEWKIIAISMCVYLSNFLGKEFSHDAREVIPGLICSCQKQHRCKWRKILK